MNTSATKKTLVQKSRKSLHRTLLSIVAFALALAIVVSGLILLSIANHNARESSANKLLMIGDILAENIAFQVGLGEGWSSEAEEVLRAARHYDDIARVCVYNNNAALFAKYLSLKSASCAEPKKSIAETSSLSSSFSISVRLPIVSQGDVLGEIELSSKGNELKNSLSLTALAIFGALIFSVVLSFIFGSRLIKLSLRPLNLLTQTGTVIAKNPHSTVRAQKLGNNEIGDLVDVFNTMLDALEIENKKLESSENTFRTLSEHAPVGVFLRNTPSVFDYVNDTWEEITGLDTEHANNFIEHISPSYKHMYLERIERLTKGIPFIKIEYEFSRPDGEKRFLQEYISTVNEATHSYYIGTLLDVTELKKTQDELEQLAYYDPLTKLPNRRFLTNHLNYLFARADKKHHKLAVFMTDLDNFKRVNDTLGHDAGDKLLQKIGDRLSSSVFREDFVARMGGDEFLILVDGITNLNSVEFISKRLLNAMNTEAIKDHNIIPVTGSVGVAMYPDDAKTPEELLRFADMALYNSKSKGGNSFNCYSADLDATIQEQIMLEQKLRGALLSGDIEVHLQPQYHAKSEKTCWAEALVRWFDKDEGYISPIKFIPIAEDSGLIHTLGDYVLERVCQMLSTHLDELQKMGIEGISVNLSAKQFFSANLETDIQLIFEKYRINPSLIEFELTESTVTDDMEHAITVMERLRDLGCRLSIDDFGTGYSSLSYLKRFPITSLKIDRTFVSDIPENKNDCEIACAIINLAHNLGMSVVAEGVETRAQVDFLAKYNCEYLQGFFLARPVSIEELLHKAGAKKLEQMTAPPSAAKMNKN